MELAAPSRKPTRPLIVFAVPEEAEPFRRALPASGIHLTRQVRAGIKGWQGEGLEVFVTGMGSRNADRVTRAVLAEVEPSWVVTAGFAGGLQPTWPRGTVAFSAGETFPHSDRLRKAGARPAQFFESRRVVVTPAEKAALFRETSADAVEMESTTIREICRKRGIPSATVRVISDAAGDTLPLDFGALMTADDRIDFRRLAWALVRSPGTLPRLMRFQREVSQAAAELARVLVALVSPG